MKIAIVAHAAYGALTGGSSGHIGGVERQTSMLARWLAARGHEVSLLTWDEGQGDGTVVDGVRAVPVCRRAAGLPGLRFFTPRWTGLVRALARTDAEVCYQNGAEYVTGQVALWCRWRGRAFVFSAASDVDVDTALPELASRRERVLYRYGLRAADRVVVQTGAQQIQARRGFGVAAVVLPMPCPGPGDDEYRQPAPPAPGSGRVLWAGRIAPVKRLEVLLEVARALPAIQFDVAGQASEGDAYAQRVLAEANGVPNVRLLGAVPRDRMPELYRGANLLLSTSSYEGFPNTFIEAWSFGLPVVSTVDPDGLLGSGALGAHAGDAAGIAAATTALLADAAHWTELSARCRAHYVANHAVDAAMSRFELLFAAAVQDRRGTAR